MLIRVSSSYFVAGLVIENNIVTRAAPIIKQYLGWNVWKTIEALTTRKWKVEML